MVDVKHPKCQCGKKMQRMYIKINQKLKSIGWYCLTCGLSDNSAETAHQDYYIEECIKGMKEAVFDTCGQCDKKSTCMVRVRAFPNYSQRRK